MKLVNLPTYVGTGKEVQYTVGLFSVCLLSPPVFDPHSFAQLPAKGTLLYPTSPFSLVINGGRMERRRVSWLSKGGGRPKEASTVVVL